MPGRTQHALDLPDVERNLPVQHCRQSGPPALSALPLVSVPLAIEETSILRIKERERGAIVVKRAEELPSAHYLARVAPYGFHPNIFFIKSSVFVQSDGLSCRLRLRE